MRSRRDDIDHTATLDRALGEGLVGMGAADDERAERRLGRLIAAPPGSFVWTRRPDGRTYLGRMTGPWRRDDAGAAADLVNVRDCDWVLDPVDAVLVPAAVVQTFARGGRNFQQIHPGDVECLTADLWERLSS